MATRRLAIYFLHEDEEALAHDVVEGDDRIVSGGYVIGDVDDERVAELEERHIAFEDLGAAADADDGGFDEFTATGGMESLGALPGVFRAAAPPTELAPGAEATWVVRVGGPLVTEWREALVADGLEVVERVSPDSYLCRGTSRAADDASLRGFVQRLDRATTQRATETALLAIGDQPATRSTLDLYDVVLDGTVASTVVAAELESKGAHVVDRGSRRVRVQAASNSPWLSDPRPLAGVLGVSAYVEPELLNDRARTLLGVDAAAPLDGTGEVVAVTDTGIDDQHPDFAGRIRSVIARGRHGDASDPNGHGTHVAGSIVGTGTASNGAIRGIAPGAELVFQSVLDERGRLGGLRSGVYDLLAEAYGLGARVFNHSWGSLAESEYRADSLEVDSFCWEHPDALVVVAAGNDGSAAAPINAPAGFVELHSLRAPATSKNALTVGAACSDRVDGPMTNTTWSAYNAARFPSGEVADALVAGDAERLAGFSSRGPCQDRRIKPDLVAPGTDILSTRSSIAPAANFWGEYGPNDAYAFMGGTSMAAPLVAGVAILLRQWYVGRGHDPSAALLKATIVNGCRWLQGADAVSSNLRAPNYDQGYGAVHLPDSLPDPHAESPRALEFLDTTTTPALQFHSDKDRPVQASVDVGSGQPLRVCMAFTDPPGRFTQNDLSLIVEGPDRTKLFGNDDRPKQFRGPDRDNTIEAVTIPDPTPGTHRIHVVAKNVLVAPQGFALVVTGNVANLHVGRH